MKKFSQALVESTLQVLTTAKLIVVNVEESFGASKGDIMSLQPSVEVIHEILIRHWSTLRWWLEENRSRIRTHRQIAQAAKLWLQNHENNDFLLQGVRLGEAEEIYIQYTDELSADTQKFIEACLVERKRLQFQEQRRLRQAQRAVIALSILGIAACSFGGLAYWQRREAKVSEIQALNQSSKANLLLNQQLEALVASIKAGKQLKNTLALPANLRISTIATLEQAISQIQERNRFEGLKTFAAHRGGPLGFGFPFLSTSDVPIPEKAPVDMGIFRYVSVLTFWICWTTSPAKLVVALPRTIDIDTAIAKRFFIYRLLCILNWM